MWRYVTLFTRRYIDVFARLKNWLSDYKRQDTDCNVVLFPLTYLRMFSHVYFVLKLVLMWRRWSVHVRYALLRLLNWGATAICHSTLNSAKTAFIVWILQYNAQNLKSEAWFHIKSTKAQCLLRYIGWEVPFNVPSINWKQARLIDSCHLRFFILGFQVSSSSFKLYLSHTRLYRDCITSSEMWIRSAPWTVQIL